MSMLTLNRRKLRTLVVSHAHPFESTGGAELAAFNLYEALLNHPSCGEVFFLAATDRPTLAVGATSLLRQNEYLVRCTEMDWFNLRSGSPHSFARQIAEFLSFSRPDVVFVHHYAKFGVEIFREIKRSMPSCQVVLTLHEYLGICNRNGQMVKMNNKKLCHSESIQACHLCFNDQSEENFWLRKHYIQRSFEFIDHFVAPSQFLLSRYIDWGIPREFSHVVENGQQQNDRTLSRSRFAQASDLTEQILFRRFAFFGQATEYKGLEVFLRAIQCLAPAVRRDMRFEVHCANLEQQGEWFKSLIDNLRRPLIQEGVLRWVGPYDHHDLVSRMEKIGWVVVPSIWWENSPMVIQEAFANSRPVICSGIGGMAEKVRDRVDGLHFSVNNPTDLAELFLECVTNRNLWDQLRRNIKSPMSLSEYADRYIEIAMS